MKKQIFCSFGKVEENDDGTLTVEGIASTGARDSAGEIVRPDAMKTALPDYLKWGAVREMHDGSKAAGTAIDAAVGDDGVTQFSAHVVDPIAITKVKTNVYKGFSIGGKVLARDPNDKTIITKLYLVEVSLVDRPCNPEAVISLWKADLGDNEESPVSQPAADEIKKRAQEMADAAGKPNRRSDYVVKAREELIAKAAQAAAETEATEGEVVQKRDYSDDERQQMAKDGQALPDGSFPIKDKNDLENAIQAYGRASNKMQAKAHIEARAHALGAEDLLPKDWDSEDEPTGKSVGADPVSRLNAALDAAKTAASTETAIETALDLSTETAIKAAWANHCLKASLADKADIRETIAKAWADKIGGEPPSVEIMKALADPKIVKAAKSFKNSAQTLEKGLPSVARLAFYVDDLCWLQESVSWEADNEGDGSKVPEMLAQNIAALCTTLSAMLAEEVAEILAGYQASGMDLDLDFSDAGDVEVIAYAASVADIVKADAVLMEKAAARLPKAPEVQEDIEKAEVIADRDRLAKALADAVPAVEDLQKSFDALKTAHAAETSELRKRLEAVENMAAPPKTAVSAYASVQKGADRAGVQSTDASAPSSDDVNKWLESLSPEQRSFELMKAAHAQPVRA